MLKYGSNNIGKIYFGSNSIGKAYYGSNLVFQKGSGPTPPPVTAIPYIRNTSLGAYIDTEITADNTVKVIIWARNFNPTGGFLFGSRVSTENNTLVLGTHDGAGTGRLRVGYGNSNDTYADNAFTLLSGYHKYELYQGVLKVDDVTVAAAPSATFSNALNIHLFGINNGGTHTDSVLPVDIHAAKIYKDGTLVRDFTAVNSPSSGLYDSVSNTLFTNAGAGTFTYGTFTPNTYTQLEYIECSGAQYFDSGVYGSYADGIVCKFMLTNTTARWGSILGYRSSASCCGISYGTSSSVNYRAYWRFGANDTSNQLYSSTSPRLTNLEVIAVKIQDGTTCRLYRNNSAIGSAASPSASSDFVTDGTMMIGAEKGNDLTQALIGRLYYTLLGTSRSYVPAKVNNVAGMYDTYNDVFKPSESGTPFIAGPEIETI